jgi:hypothetical protein
MMNLEDRIIQDTQQSSVRLSNSRGCRHGVGDKKLSDLQGLCFEGPQQPSNSHFHAIS